MKRRFFCGAGASALAFQLNPALAALPIPNDGFFHWRRPGWQPYDRQGAKLDSALREFRDLLAPDPDVEAELRQKVQSGQHTPAQVFAGWRATRMLFGRNTKARNVIVDASDLAAWGNASRILRMYTAQRNSGNVARFYALFYPEVCGNWSMRLGQRECILDTVMCDRDQGCRELQRMQYKS